VYRIREELTKKSKVAKISPGDSIYVRQAVLTAFLSKAHGFTARSVATTLQTMIGMPINDVELLRVTL
jgi:hypothetical protein